MFASKRCSQTLQNAMHHIQTIHIPFYTLSRCTITSSHLFNHYNILNQPPYNQYIFNSKRYIQQKQNNDNNNDIEVSVQLLEDTLSIIQYGSKKIFLIGSDHLSVTSAQV